MSAGAKGSALSSAFILAISLGTSGCGGDSLCGNGTIDKGEECDEGSKNGTPGGCTTTCTLTSTPTLNVQVAYQRLVNEVPGYGGSACSDLGIAQAQVVLFGPTDADMQMVSLTCASNSNIWSNVAAGSYHGSVTLFDAQQVALTKTLSTTPMTLSPPTNAMLSVDFHQTDFIKQDYTGSMYIVPEWGSASGTCSSAAVTKESIKLFNSSGAVVSGMTSKGHSLDGAEGTCFTPSSSTDGEQIDNLPWGHYHVQLVGRDSSDAISYCKLIEVFVGPGVANAAVEVLASPATDLSGCTPN